MLLFFFAIIFNLEVNFGHATGFYINIKLNNKNNKKPKMIESLIQAKREMHRLEHVLYVSLKYTRTKEILLNALRQLDQVLMWCVTTLMKYKFSSNEKEIPTQPLKKISILETKCEQDFTKYFQLAREMRKLLRIDFKAENEFRKNVKLVGMVDGKLIEIDIKKLFEYYDLVKEFLEKVEDIIIEAHRKQKQNKRD